MTTTTRPYDFDTIIDRRNTDAIKWTMHGEDVLPMWVAEMEFQSAPEILQALHQRVEHGVFGYTINSEGLRDATVERMAELYNWQIQPDWIVFNPGMVLMLNVMAQCVGKAGDGIIFNSPVYGPFYNIAKNRGFFAQGADMVRVDDDANTFHYELDFDAFENAITDQTSMYFLCDPHNPTGKIYTRAEQERLAEICLKHDLTIAADHIHADLLMDGNSFQPIATISPEVAQKTVTMFSSTKTFNVPGLACTIAIVPNEDLRIKMSERSFMSGYHVNTLAFTAAEAGYRHGGAWLNAALAYMTENRNILVDFIRNELPMLKTSVPEATYLAWIDCSALNIGEQSLQDFFVERGKVAFSPGEFFGKAGKSFVRFNYAAPRSMVQEALKRMKTAIDTL